jgi:hypothetical protein
MSSMLRRVFARITMSTHLSDDTLSRLISGELNGAQTRRAQEHLAKCWQCGSRREQLEKAAFGFVEYHKHLVAPNLPQSPKWRDLFLAQLDRSAQEVQPATGFSRLNSHYRRLALNHMNPVLASAVIVMLAAAMLFIVWQRNIPKVSAHELLERAVKSDAGPAKDAERGVVYQKIRIRTAKQTLERSLYRDVEGRRHPKPQKTDDSEAQLRTKLAIAGVNWDEPLSAAPYKDWHDRLPEKKDAVSSTGNHLLTLKTAVSDGIVEQESLTVRDTDFHPVERTVEFRDLGTVEIAELNYDVLSWSAVNDSLFEALGVATSAALHALPRITLPTKEELDNAELKALLVLNRLDADTGEQIHVSRSSSSIHVKGIVETNQRKQELLAQLGPLPHVSSSILSVEELNAHPSPAVPPITSIKEYSTTGQPSPLEKYFREQSKDLNDLSRTSQAILDASLSVGQESGAIGELLQRFAADPRLSEPAATTMDDLVARHIDRLSGRLQTEEQTIEQLGISAQESTAAADASVEKIAEQLSSAAERNQALCRELITGSDSSPRPAASIAGELLTSINDFRAILKTLNTASADNHRPPDGQLQKR